jgi:hypothetical protein
MLKRLTLVVLLVALVAGSADASIYRGKRGRRYCRRQGLILYLHSDALKVYEEYGYPVHRLRIREIDSTVERWTYHKAGRQFFFDENQKIIRVKKFFPEDRRERMHRWDKRKVRNPRTYR